MRWVVLALASCDAVFGLDTPTVSGGGDAQQDGRADGNAMCPAPYIETQTGFYRLIGTTMSFDGAEVACANDENTVPGLMGHTHLAVLSHYTTTAEHNVVFQFFFAQFTSSAQFWIGLAAPAATPNNWQWITD